MVAELLDVSHRYGSVAALTDVSLTLEAGQVTALLGPNGAGKTTAVSLLTGLVRPTEGQARLFGGDPQSVAARRRIGVMLQVSKVPETLTVREHLTLFASYYAAPLPLKTLLDLAGLTEVADRRYGRLSGGQQQRVLFALAVCGNPELLFLDEPTVGMDVESRRTLLGRRQDVHRRRPFRAADDALPRGGRCAGPSRRAAGTRAHRRRRHAGRDQAAGRGTAGPLPVDAPHQRAPCVAGRGLGDARRRRHAADDHRCGPDAARACRRRPRRVRSRRARRRARRRFCRTDVVSSHGASS